MIHTVYLYTLVVELPCYSCLSMEGNRQNGDEIQRLAQQLKTLTDQISDIQSRITGNDIASQAADTSPDDQDQQRRRHMEAHISAAQAIFADASVYNQSIAGIMVGHSSDVADLTDTFGSVIGLNDDQKHRTRQWLLREDMIDGMYHSPYCG